MNIYIDRYTPEFIDFRFYEGKGVGMITTRDIRHGEVIYEFPICKIPEGDVNIITGVGHINFVPTKHLSHFGVKHNIFPYWDCLLNHDDNPNALHDYKFESKHGRFFGKLYATRDINYGEEILINYNNLIDPEYVLIDDVSHPASDLVKYIPTEF